MFFKKTINAITLFIPALIPSWNFFDSVNPSPTIQYLLLEEQTSNNAEWLDFRPRPNNISFKQMLTRLLWNPKWNESLFLVSCCERIAEQLSEDMTAFCEKEIFERLKYDLKPNKVSQLQFRILIIQKQDDKFIEEIIYQSKTQHLTDIE